jgi:hypothetical protein
MKKLLFCKLLLVTFIVIGPQLYAQEVISSAGDHSSGNTIQVSWTIGEPVIETGMNGQYILTQGMHQGNLIVTKLNEIEGLDIEISAYPNPVSKYLNLDIDAPILNGFTYALYDVNGQLLKRQEVSEPITVIPMDSYSHSSYVLRVIRENQEVKVFKVIKNK